MPERLQKYLAAAGIASRRKAEALILAGRVQVNSTTVTELGTKVEPGKDLVTVDGKLVEASGTRAYYLLYKPSGCVTTASDPEGRPTALDYLRRVRERVFPVGRLDWDAEGAVLFTDDGELANRLAHPRYGHRRTYLVKVKGDPAPEALLRMTAGVRLEDGPARALEATVHDHAEKNVWVRVVVGEGRYHLVKRLCEAVGLQVQRLFRPEFGGVTVERLRPGAFRPLDAAEVRRMRQTVGLEGGAAEPAPAMPRSLLPKAARRHGHGPPAPPQARPAPEAREATRPSLPRGKPAPREAGEASSAPAAKPRSSPGARWQGKGERGRERSAGSRGPRPDRPRQRGPRRSPR
jgi:23S rRNA pseudouridine2605 synthase